jgi:hypothetical protein
MGGGGLVGAHTGQALSVEAPDDIAIVGLRMRPVGTRRSNEATTRVPLQLRGHGVLIGTHGLQIVDIVELQKAVSARTESSKHS